MRTIEKYKLPHDCKDIGEVRNEIDKIDFEIIKLYGQRFQYVKKITEYKDKTQESIIAAKRKEMVIEKRREWASENGLDPDVFEKIYRLLIDYFISEELKLVKIEPK